MAKQANHQPQIKKEIDKEAMFKKIMPSCVRAPSESSYSSDTADSTNSEPQSGVMMAAPAAPTAPVTPPPFQESPPCEPQGYAIGDERNSLNKPLDLNEETQIDLPAQDPPELRSDAKLRPVPVDVVQQSGPFSVQIVVPQEVPAEEVYKPDIIIEENPPENCAEIQSVNLVELIVKAHLPDVIKRMHCCNCEKCQNDVAAIALNRLDPIYKLSQEITDNDYFNRRLVSDTVFSLTQAALTVKVHPNHQSLE